MMGEKIQRAVKMIKENKKIVVLTGAGISTESGIPDFRSPKTGLWEKIDPMEALSTHVLFNKPKKFYEVGFKILTSMKDAKPNRSHEILAALEKEEYISLLITQNIDNLHEKAGTKNVFEVHGHIRSGFCIDCKEEMLLEDIEEQIKMGKVPPRCNNCNGVVRPSVVMFGDPLPSCFERAWIEVQNADLLIVIGSSLSVAPVNYLAQICKKLMIINIGPTFYDDRADLVINGGCSEILEKIYKGLEK